MIHYYIYPAGGGGHSVAWLIDFFNRIDGTNVTYTFIDDSSNETSLESIYKSILSNEVLVCSDRLYESLIDKLLKIGINYFSNGIKKYAERLNEYFSGSRHKNVGFICDDYKSQKHFGSIDIQLKDKDYDVYYFMLFRSYENRVGMLDNELLIVNDFLPYLTFCPLVLGTTLYYNMHNCVKYVNIPSSYYIPRFHSYYHSIESLTEILTRYNIATSVNHYIVSPNVKSYEYLKNFFDRHYGGASRLLKFGYPGLDIEQSPFQEKCKEDTLIIASFIVNEKFRILIEKLIKTLLDMKIRVLFKAHNGHPELLDKERDFCEQWLEDENFIFYTLPNLTAEELKRSITLIESRSSLLYTYPFKAFCVRDVLDIVECLKNEEFSLERKQTIEDYRKNDTYCFGESSKNIANFIDEYFRKYL